MTRVLGALLLVAVSIGVLGVAQTAVIPRVAEGVLLFDNETDGDVGRLGILFDGPVALCKEDIVAFGGGAVTRLDVGVRTAWIDVAVVPGGTLQISLASDAQVSSAYWVSTPEEKNKVVFQWFVDVVWNQHDGMALPEFMSPTVLVHGDSIAGGELPGLEGFGMFATAAITGFPDIHFSIEDLAAAEDEVAVRLSLTGTHDGPFGPVPATGMSAESRNLIIYRFADGKIEEAWLQLDGLGIMVQLGVIPPMGSSDLSWGPPSPATGDPGTPEGNASIASRDLNEVWNGGDLSVIDPIIGEDFVGHFDLVSVGGREAYAQYVSATLATYPDYHVTIEDAIAEGDLVFLRFTVSATHLGPLGSIPATGMPWTEDGIVAYRIADGMIVEAWQLIDMLSVLMQIGIVPPLQ